MPFNVDKDAHAQVKMLLAAAGLAIVLSLIPYADILMYPFRLFVTFIHEGGHAIAAIATGGSVRSLLIAPDGSGQVLSSYSGVLSGLIISSAGYLGATFYGAMLLVLIRRKVAARIVLFSTAAFILLMTLRFGFLSPFTLASGIGLSAALALAARFAQAPVANFLLSFVAIQCVMNALFDLRTLLSLSSPMGVPVHTDAVNMARATGIPAVVWAVLWIGISLLVLKTALKFYMAAPQPVPTPTS